MERTNPPEDQGRGPLILIAIGSNLPGEGHTTPLACCQWAISQLALLPGLRVDRMSQWYSSSPMPPSDQPRYVNGVISLLPSIIDHPGPSPEQLLAFLHAIENRAGRRRSIPNAARSLDLDLIAIGDCVRAAAASPVLPHPRMHMRDFVLWPLAEIAPSWQHPVSGQTVQDMAVGLPRSDIHVMESDTAQS